MRRPGFLVFGWALAVLGLLIAFFPMASVWQASGDVLDELPPIAADNVQDDRNRLALARSDFLLASRHYDGITVDEVTAALTDAGFDRQAGLTPSRLPTYTKECCGEYDAVWVTVRADENETAAVTVTVTVELTVADSDVQVSWLVFAMFGILLAVAGSGMVIAGSRRNENERGDSEVTGRSDDDRAKLAR